MSAALAFYALLALAPVLMLALFAAAQVLGDAGAREQLFLTVERNLGLDVARTIESALASVRQASLANWTGVGAILLAVWAASGLFGVVTDSLNSIWKYRPQYGGILRSLLIDRLIAAFLALIFISMLLGWMMFDAFRGYVAVSTGGIGKGPIASFLLSWLFLTVALGTVYRAVPHRHANWREVWLGASVAALLIAALKFALGLYLSFSHIDDVYHSAASVVVILLWFYYSAQAFFFGAEIVHTVAAPRRAA